MPSQLPRATTQAIIFLLSKLNSKQKVQLNQLAIDNQISVKEYVGALAARHGLLHWIEAPSNSGPREGNA